MLDIILAFELTTYRGKILGSKAIITFFEGKYAQKNNVFNYKRCADRMESSRGELAQRWLVFILDT